MAIRAFIIAPSLAVRLGLRALLATDPEMLVVGEAASLGEQQPAGVEADVVIWLPTVPPRLEAGQPGLAPEAALLLLSDDPAAAAEIAALPLRAWGVLSQDASREELAAAVRALHEGLAVGEPALMRRLLGRTPAAADGEQVEPLTGREAEVLQLLAQGLANKQIAAALQISAHTVKFHISSIYSKLGAASRTEAVRLGLQHGLIVL